MRIMGSRILPYIIVAYMAVWLVVSVVYGLGRMMGAWG
jgi:hypothetical protein